MNKFVFYEWDVEEVASVDSKEYAVDDVIDHSHCATFAEAMADKIRFDAAKVPGVVFRLVLVRDDDRPDGCRSWAYVDEDDGLLDEWFEDAYARQVSKVPKRFHEEVARWKKNNS